MCKLEDQQREAIKRLQEGNRVALTKLEQFNKKATTSKYDGDPFLDPDDK